MTVTGVAEIRLGRSMREPVTVMLSAPLELSYDFAFASASACGSAGR